MFDGICEAIHKEMEGLEKKYAEGAPMTVSDLEHIDKMAHALKSIAGYEAMKGSSEYGGSYEGSYARGRSRATGRYISRDGGYSREGSGMYSRDAGDPYWDRR